MNANTLLKPLTHPSLALLCLVRAVCKNPALTPKEKSVWFKEKDKKMKNKIKLQKLVSLALLTAALFVFTNVGCAQEKTEATKESSVKAVSVKGKSVTLVPVKKSSEPVTKEERLKWFTDAKFGMFIHWGLYAVAAGEWKGKEVITAGEWIMLRAKIPVAEYEKLASQFNPVQFDADAWAQLAQDAGMKYMVITAKHHEGFSMYDSKVSKYNIVDATPFKRDPMKELAAACAKRGIKFGFYYSHAQDWYEKNASGNTWDWPNRKEFKKNFAIYFEEKVKPQVKELLTQYGPIGQIWFDMPAGVSREQSIELVNFVHGIQPNCLVNSRVCSSNLGPNVGDYKSMGDNAISPTIMDEPWETAATLTRTWGYKKSDNNYESTETLIQNLVTIVSNGGNYLLNAGPTAEGIIPESIAVRFREMGKWLKLNGESIYGATPSPIGMFPWGRCTAKPGKLYIHLFNWPSKNKLELSGLKKEVKNAYLLADKDRTALSVKTEGDKTIITLPERAPDKFDTVVVLETEK